MTNILAELDRLENIARQATPKDSYDHVLSSPLRAACMLSRSMNQRQGAKIPEVAQGSAPQWFIDEMVSFKEICLRDHTGLDPQTAIRLVSALREVLKALDQVQLPIDDDEPWESDSKPCGCDESDNLFMSVESRRRIARKAKEQIEAMFRDEGVKG